MGKKTKIDWCDHTWSPWWGCAPVSEGCQHCYARVFDRRISGVDGGHWGTATERGFFGDAYWAKPLAWNRAAAKAGVRRRVFPSMCDPFEDLQLGHVNRGDMAIARLGLWELIRMTPWLDWLLLTKRPTSIPQSWRDDWPANAWVGVTAENQRRADERIPLLLQVPAAVHFVSVEPQLGPVVLPLRRPNPPPGSPPLGSKPIDLVICGAESGPRARPFSDEWARIHRDVCMATGVKFFFKQNVQNVWVCSSKKCPSVKLYQPAPEPYKVGDREPCVHCATGDSRVARKLVKMPELDGKVWAELP